MSPVPLLVVVHLLVPDPIGVGLLEAIAVCHGQTDSVDFLRAVQDNVLPGTRRVNRWYQGFADALAAAPRGVHLGVGLVPVRLPRLPDDLRE